MKYEENIFAKRLREVREDLNLMQKEMAQKLNMPITTYNGYETGKRSPSLEILRNISDILDVSIDYLLGKSNKKSSLTNIELLKIKDISKNDEITELVKKLYELDPKTQKKVKKMIDAFVDDDDDM